MRPRLLQARLSDLKRRLDEKGVLLPVTLDRRVRLDRQRFGATAQRLRADPLVRENVRLRAQLDEKARRLSANGRARLDALSDRLEALDRLRQTLGYEATLKRGYAVVRGDGDVVTTKAQAKKAGSLEIQFADGRLDVAGGPKASAPRKPKAPPKDQGSLF